jgi:anti-sigma factor RsiW
VPSPGDRGSDPGGDRLTATHPAATHPAATHPAAACRATAAQADAWIDGALPADARAAVDGHLRACPLCRASVAALYRLVTAVRRHGARQPPAPASLRARVQALTARWRAAEAAADADVGVAPAIPGRPVR